MTDPSSSSIKKDYSVLGIGCVVALLVLIAIMVGSIYYPYPNGNHLDFWGFIALWAKEIIIGALSLLVGITFAVAWLVRLIRGKARGS